MGEILQQGKGACVQRLRWPVNLRPGSKETAGFTSANHVALHADYCHKLLSLIPADRPVHSGVRRLVWTGIKAHTWKQVVLHAQSLSGS